MGDIKRLGKTINLIFSFRNSAIKEKHDTGNEKKKMSELGGHVHGMLTSSGVFLCDLLI